MCVMGEWEHYYLRGDGGGGGRVERPNGSNSLGPVGGSGHYCFI